MDPPLEFQAGDILGIFQPHRGNSRISVNFERDNGPPNYYITIGSEVVEPPLEEFAIADSETRIESDTPLIAVEISK